MRGASPQGDGLALERGWSPKEGDGMQRRGWKGVLAVKPTRQEIY